MDRKNKPPAAAQTKARRKQSSKAIRKAERDAEPLWQKDHSDPALTPEERRRILSAKYNRKRRQEIKQKKAAPALEVTQTAYICPTDTSEVQIVEIVQQIKPKQTKRLKQCSNTMTFKMAYNLGTRNVMWSPPISLKDISELVKSSPEDALMHFVTKL